MTSESLEIIPGEDAAQLVCIISSKPGRYLSATRSRRPMGHTVSYSVTLFQAVENLINEGGYLLAVLPDGSTQKVKLFDEWWVK